LRAILRRHYRSSSQQIVDIILASVEDFRQSMEQEDDITLIVLKSHEIG